MEHFEKQIQLCFLLGSQNWKIWRIIFEIDVLERVQLYSPPPSGAILIYCFIINLVLIPELIKTFYIYQLYSILDSKKHLGSACRSPAYRSIYIYICLWSWVMTDKILSTLIYICWDNRGFHMSYRRIREIKELQNLQHKHNHGVLYISSSRKRKKKLYSNLRLEVQISSRT